MASERLSSFDLLKIHHASVMEDLADVNFARYEGEIKLKNTIDNLRITRDLHYVLAGNKGEGYRTGDFTTSNHAQILRKWGKEPREKHLLFPSGFVSGIGFSLKIGDSRKYVVLDVLSHHLEEFPRYAEILIDAGYTVLDALYHRIDKDIDYGIFWTQRKD